MSSKGNHLKVKSGVKDSQTPLILGAGNTPRASNSALAKPTRLVLHTRVSPSACLLLTDIFSFPTYFPTQAAVKNNTH